MWLFPSSVPVRFAPPHRPASVVNTSYSREIPSDQLPTVRQGDAGCLDLTNFTMVQFALEASPEAGAKAAKKLKGFLAYLQERKKVVCTDSRLRLNLNGGLTLPCSPGRLP